MNLSPMMRQQAYRTAIHIVNFVSTCPDRGIKVICMSEKHADYIRAELKRFKLTSEEMERVQFVVPSAGQPMRGSSPDAWHCDLIGEGPSA